MDSIVCVPAFALIHKSVLYLETYHLLLLFTCGIFDEITSGGKLSGYKVAYVQQTERV